jgi:hypothetical protein
MMLDTMQRLPHRALPHGTNTHPTVTRHDSQRECTICYNPSNDVMRASDRLRRMSPACPQHGRKAAGRAETQ